MKWTDKMVVMEKFTNDTLFTIYVVVYYRQVWLLDL